MTEPIMALLSWLNEWFFSPISALVLLFAGIILSVKLKFFQFSNPAKLFRLMCEKKNGDGNSPFRALTLALAGTLGVGNISGVALALAYGGAGAIFWMWVSAEWQLPASRIRKFLTARPFVWNFSTTSVTKSVSTLWMH